MSPKARQGRRQDDEGACAGLVHCWGGRGTSETTGPGCWEAEAPPPEEKEGPGKAERTGAHTLAAGSPRRQCLRWGGYGQGPLGSLVGSRGTSPVVGGRGSGGRGSSPAQGPTPSSAGASPACVARAAHWPPLREPALSRWNQRPTTTVPSLPPHRGLPGLHELSPAQPAPQDNMRTGTPVSRRRCQLTSASAPGRGQGRGRRRVSAPAPWASDIVFRSGGGGARAGGCSLETLGREDMGRPWPGPGPGGVSIWGLL